MEASRKPLYLDWMQVEVSSLCDGGCIYCPRHCLRDEQKGGLMDWRTFERLEPAFPGADLVYLQGWGEPLLHPDVWRMIRRVKESGAAAGFTTNGARLDEGNRKRLVESGLNILGVSLAGTTAATHERFRPACRLRRIDEALTTLAEWKRKQRSEQPELHLAYLLLRSNLDETPAVVDLASRWGASQVIVSNLSWTGAQEMREESTLLHPELWPRAAKILKRARNDARKRGILLHYYGPAIGEPRPTCTENVLSACFVSHRGDVSPCVLTTPSLPGAQPIVFGNVNERSLTEIWRSPMAHDFRRVFRARRAMEHPGTEGLPPACAECCRLREL